MDWFVEEIKWLWRKSDWNDEIEQWMKCKSLSSFFSLLISIVWNSHIWEWDKLLEMAIESNVQTIPDDRTLILTDDIIDIKWEIENLTWSNEIVIQFKGFNVFSKGWSFFI